MEILCYNKLFQIMLRYNWTARAPNNANNSMNHRSELCMTEMIWICDLQIILWLQENKQFSHLNTAKHNHIGLHANAQSDLPMKMRIKTANVHKNKNKRTLM